MKIMTIATIITLSLMPLSVWACNKINYTTDQSAMDRSNDGQVQSQQPTPADRAAASLNTEPKKLRDIRD